jgi:hypothetical protein
MSTPSISPELPPPSNESRSNLNHSSGVRLFTLADKARATEGILTPTETLELVDFAEYCYHKLQDTHDELESILWDYSHPTHKDR